MKKVLILLFVLLSCSLYSQEVYLLSVGISDYPGTTNDLRLSANDAKTIHELYKLNNQAISKILLNDQATRDAILTSARNLFKNAQPEDIVVFYFSGHGYPSGFVAHDGYLLYKDLKDVFSACKSKHKMIFADACFSGQLRDTRKATKEDHKPFDVMLFLSSRHNEVSYEVPGMMENGFFTACLAKCLKGGADVNRDRVITAKELYDAVSRGVVTLSEDTQHPVMWGNFDDNMIVMKW